MADTLYPLDIPGGIYRNGTKFQAKARWYDGNLVRFRDKNVVLPIGGWRRAPDDGAGQVAALVGVPRGAAAWKDDSGSIHIGIGTTQKLYALAGGVLHDITPAGFVAGRVDTVVPGNNPGVTSQGSSLYGQGPYGSGDFGKGSTLGVRLEADTWQLESFAGTLAAVCTSDGRLVTWDGDPAVLPTVPIGAPTQNRGVVITPENFLVVLGAYGDVRRVAWPSQATTDQWDALSTNSAGDFDLNSDGILMCGKKTRKETILWTDADIWTMTYVGGDLIYRFDQVGEKCGIVSPRASVVVDTQAIWMGRKSFYVYDGYVRPLPSEVHDYVFSDMNETQSTKIFAMTVAQFGEVWWFYPSAASQEVDRYVVYNYREGFWYIGQLARSAGVDTSGVTAYPVMVKPTGEIYEHEYGFNREGLKPYLESGPVAIGDGRNVMLVRRYVPDEKTLGDTQLTLYGSMAPTKAETAKGPFAIEAETPTRMSAKYVRLRLDEVNATDWRLGTPQLDAVPAGTR